MQVIRALRADEIECRVSQVTAKGIMLLLYKDARSDMAILDETFTPMGWQRRHTFISNKEYCTISVRDKDTGEWVEKQDCGTESNTEKEKGQSSDAFKRAGFNWGVGRELYTKIFIFINVDTVKNDKSKFEMVDRFAKFIVTSIETDNKAKKILNLEISDKRGNIVFKWNNDNPPIYDDVDDAPRCVDCGAEVKGYIKNDITYTPQEAYEKLNSRCVACFRKQNATGN